MQTMNTDQPSYYTNMAGPHQGAAGYYAQHIIDQQFTPRNSNPYSQGPRMQGNPYNTPMTNNYPQQQVFVQQSFQHPGTFVGGNAPRVMAPQFANVIRPSNENPNGTQTFSPQSYQTFISGQAMYAPAQYSGYQMLYSPPQSQATNLSQAQYHGANGQQVTQSPQTSQQASLDQQHGQPSQPSQTRDKRQRKPLAIVDPTSNKEVELPKSTVSANATTTEDSVTDSTNPKAQIQAQFRQQFAQLLNSNPQTEKNANESSSEEPSIKENQPEDVPPSSTSSSRSGSISKQSFEQPQPTQPDIDTESITEEKPTEDQNPPEPVTTDSPSTPNVISPSESIENVPLTVSDDTENESVVLGKTPSGSKRYGYTIEELRRKQLSLLSQERPAQLKEIAGVTSPAIPKHPPKPKIDGDKQYIRDVTAILNKLTPSNYQKLIQQLDELELNSPERLSGLITVTFTKAVETSIFCWIYADLCKHFQRKQVTVPNESGQPETFYFRQVLLSRCQKEFENDFRQEIEYEKRRAEVDAIADEKTRKDAAEQLEEDLLKAKRKKLGNIIFIGELFKLDMLTDTIMYDCIEYLLRDKTDEESLECLCRLLRIIGAKLDSKAGDKTPTRKLLEKHYVELVGIVTQRQASARIRFMIQDLMEMRRAGWVARREEVKPTTITEIHEQARLKREQEDFDRERDKQQRREQNRGGGGPQQYTESRGGSRGSGVRQQQNRNDDDRIDNRVIVDSLRQYQSNEKRNQGQLPLNLAPQRAWGKGSGVDKKVEDDRSNTGRTGGKPPVGLNPAYRSKTGNSPGVPGYPTQGQSSRELARDNSFRDRENAKQALRKTTHTVGASNPNNSNSRESLQNVSREQSRNVSPDSNVNDRTPSSTRPTTTDNNVTPAFDEQKTQAHVHSLIEEYTGNYSDNNDRPVNEAIEDLTSFCTANVNQQAIVARELFTNVLEAKPRARKAVGHLLDVALAKNILSTEGFQSGLKLFIEVVPDYAVDIPLIWQYIGEILGAFIGAPSSNMLLLKSILQSIPEPKTKQLFQDMIRYAVEFSSKNQIQKSWQATGYSLNDLLQADSSFLNEYNWLTDPVESEIIEEPTTVTITTTTKENLTPRADSQLVKLFKSINVQGTTVSDEEILTYIRENMDSTEKYYIRKIVLSYLEACLINREPQKKIQEDIAKQRMTVLNAIMKNRPKDEVQAVYAIQNFVSQLEHPSKMARLLFDIFYDEECVSEEAFFEWLNQPDPSETEGHAVVGLSTKDFFEWLEQPGSDAEEEEES